MLSSEIFPVVDLAKVFICAHSFVSKSKQKECLEKTLIMRKIIDIQYGDDCPVA